MPRRAGARSRRGPPADQVAEARSTTSAARTALASATERAATLNGPPAATAVREAEDRVAQAQAALARARADGSASPEIDPRARDALLAQKEIEQARAEVASLEKDLAATRLLAPFAGTVVSMQVRPGDPLEARAAGHDACQARGTVIRVDLTERDAGRLAVGQKATVKLDGGGDDAPLSASLVGLVEDTTAGRVALLEVAWPTTSPVPGTTARVAVTSRKRRTC